MYGTSTSSQALQGAVLENRTPVMLDEALLSLFVSDSEDEEFSGFSVNSDNE